MICFLKETDPEPQNLYLNFPSNVGATKIDMKKRKHVHQNL